MDEKTRQLIEKARAQITKLTSDRCDYNTRMQLFSICEPSPTMRAPRARVPFLRITGFTGNVAILPPQPADDGATFKITDRPPAIGGQKTWYTWYDPNMHLNTEEDGDVVGGMRVHRQGGPASIVFSNKSPECPKKFWCNRNDSDVQNREE